MIKNTTSLLQLANFVVFLKALSTDLSFKSATFSFRIQKFLFHTLSDSLRIYYFSLWRADVKYPDQGGKRPGGETGSPLLGQCVMRRRTGTSAQSALPVQLMAVKNLLSTNRK